MASRRGERLAQVTVLVIVNGRELARQTTSIESWAVPYVTHATLVQSEDPDYEGAASSLARGRRRARTRA